MPAVPVNLFFLECLYSVLFPFCCYRSCLTLWLWGEHRLSSWGPSGLCSLVLLHPVQTKVPLDPSAVGLLGIPPVCAGQLQPGQGSTFQYGLLSKTLVIRAASILPYHTESPCKQKGCLWVHKGWCKQKLRWQHQRWCWSVPQVLSALSTASWAASHERQSPAIPELWGIKVMRKSDLFLLQYLLCQYFNPFFISELPLAHGEQQNEAMGQVLCVAACFWVCLQSCLSSPSTLGSALCHMAQPATNINKAMLKPVLVTAETWNLHLIHVLNAYIRLA